MKLSFDQTTDYSYRELHKFLKKVAEIPEYIKTASYDISNYNEIKCLPKQAFADQYNRAFPKNNKIDTYLSYVHFLNKKADLEKKYNKAYIDEVEGRLKIAATLFNISEDLDKYAASYVQKEASDYTQHTIFEKEINGNTICLYNFKTASELKQAAESFSKEYNRIPFEWRFDISKNFVKHAQDFELEELPNIICKYAGMFFAHPQEVETELNRRALYINNKEYKENYNKLAAQIYDIDSPEEFMKIASACYYMEKLDGIYDNSKRANAIGDPIDKIFNLSVEKIASELDVIKIGNYYFRISDLKDIDTEIYKQAFGADLNPSDTDELRDILPTMPLSDVSLFRELSGIRPV
jgi:hypothetical protein